LSRAASADAATCSKISLRAPGSSDTSNGVWGVLGSRCNAPRPYRCSRVYIAVSNFAAPVPYRTGTKSSTLINLGTRVPGVRDLLLVPYLDVHVVGVVLLNLVVVLNLAKFITLQVLQSTIFSDTAVTKFS
jgi:hypothetical protein